jgi:hypothetical protein
MDLANAGGRPVFIGPMELALPYFETVLGYSSPADQNPTDFM